MKAPNKTFRIFADVDYLNPSYDEYGFLIEPNLINRDESLIIHPHEVGELIAEVTAPDADVVHQKVRRLAHSNRNIAILTLREGDIGVVEL